MAAQVTAAAGLSCIIQTNQGVATVCDLYLGDEIHLQYQAAYALPGYLSKSANQSASQPSSIQPEGPVLIILANGRMEFESDLWLLRGVLYALYAFWVASLCKCHFMNLPCPVLGAYTPPKIKCHKSRVQGAVEMPSAVTDCD